MHGEERAAAVRGASAVVALDARVRVPQHVVYRGLPAETAVLNVETGEYHGLTPEAGRALELLDKLGSVRQAASKLAAETGDPLEESQRVCLALCGRLANLGLIEVRHQTG
ncbi:MAG TPA: PqqD family protein [Thermoleophilaceae bacterium]|jgi:hypothetical protein